jgi:hypothetical protein
VPSLASIPSLFRELHAAGRFDYWGTTEPMTAEQRVARLRARATEVLWWDVIEWDRSPDDVAAYDGDGLLRPGLLPFAGNGAGDHYSWYPAWQDGPEPPVLLVEHDSETSGVFAPDLAGCLVRCMVQHFAWHTFEPGEPDRRTLWDAHAAILRPHVGSTLAALLDDLGRDPSAERCEAVQGSLAGADGRRLVAIMQPTKYDDDLSPDVAKDCYARSVRFYEELVAEGRPEYADRLAQAHAHQALSRKATEV